MQTIVIPRDDTGTSALSWEPCGEGAAVLVCPNGHNCAIGVPGITRHTVADDGTVTPSVVCPECDFHEFVTLDGWQP